MAVDTSSTATRVENVPYDQPWLTSVLRPFLVALLVGCLAYTALFAVARIWPALASVFLPVMMGLSGAASLIGCVTTTWLEQPAQRHRRTPGYRLTELALLLLLTRLLIWLIAGNWPTFNLLMTHPLDALLDGPFVAGGIVVAASWLLANALTDDLLKLALRPDELFAIATDRIGEMVRSSYNDRPALLRAVVNRWVGGGLLMVLLAATLQLGPAENGFFALGRQNIPLGVIAAVVIYFLVGLVLISQGQLALLRARWMIDRVPSTPTILRNWPLYAGLVLGGVALCAALLPFGGTFWLARILGYTLALIFNGIFGFFRFLMELFMLLLALLLGNSPPVQEAAPTAAPAPVTLQPPVAAAHLPAWVGGAAFWLVMALLLGYGAYIYFSGKGFKLSWLVALWRQLRTRWQQLFGSYRQWQQARLRNTRKENVSSDQATGEDTLSWWARRNLTPEQRVRYLYLALVRQAETTGFRRRAAETPLQYAPRLAAKLTAQFATPVTEQTSGEASKTAESTASLLPEQAVHELTTAFVQVRYAQKPITAKELPRLQQVWEWLKTQLGGLAGE